MDMIDNHCTWLINLPHRWAFHDNICNECALMPLCFRGKCRYGSAPWVYPYLINPFWLRSSSLQCSFRQISGFFDRIERDTLPESIQAQTSPLKIILTFMSSSLPWMRHHYHNRYCLLCSTHALLMLYSSPTIFILLQFRSQQRKTAWPKLKSNRRLPHQLSSWEQRRQWVGYVTQYHKSGKHFVNSA
jgi:hypothetical protein